MTRVSSDRNVVSVERPSEKAAESPACIRPGDRRTYVDREALRRWLAGLAPEELAAIRAGRPLPSGSDDSSGG